MIVALLGALYACSTPNVEFAGCYPGQQVFSAFNKAISEQEEIVAREVEDVAAFMDWFNKSGEPTDYRAPERVYYYVTMNYPAALVAMVNGDCAVFIVTVPFEVEGATDFLRPTGLRI